MSLATIFLIIGAVACFIRDAWDDAIRRRKIKELETDLLTIKSKINHYQSQFNLKGEQN